MIKTFLVFILVLLYSSYKSQYSFIEKDNYLYIVQFDNGECLVKDSVMLILHNLEYSICDSNFVFLRDHGPKGFVPQITFYSIVAGKKKLRNKIKLPVNYKEKYGIIDLILYECRLLILKESSYIELKTEDDIIDFFTK